jgi:hypothetical protein
MNVQVPPEHTWSRPHVRPQAPQLSRSVCVDTQRSAAPPSASPAQRVSPAVQSGTQALF